MPVLTVTNQKLSQRKPLPCRSQAARLKPIRAALYTRQLPVLTLLGLFIWSSTLVFQSGFDGIILTPAGTLAETRRILLWSAMIAAIAFNATHWNGRVAEVLSGRNRPSTETTKLARTGCNGMFDRT